MARIRRITALGLVVAAALLHTQPALAYGDKKWCVIYSTGFDTAHERCEFSTFEECRREAVLQGSTAFCNLNPRYPENWSQQPRHRLRNDRRHHR
jgi:hypothetical protein